MFYPYRGERAYPYKSFMRESKAEARERKRECDSRDGNRETKERA